MKGWGEVVQVISEETDQYAFGNKTLEAAISDMQQRAEEVMREATE